MIYTSDNFMFIDFILFTQGLGKFLMYQKNLSVLLIFSIELLESGPSKSFLHPFSCLPFWILLQVNYSTWILQRRIWRFEWIFLFQSLQKHFLVNLFWVPIHVCVQIERLLYRIKLFVLDVERLKVILEYRLDYVCKSKLIYTELLC